MPNASDVHGIVKDKLIDEKEDVVYIKLYVNRADNFKSMPNFVKEDIGKEITLTVSKDDLDFFERNEVELLVSISGDEKHQLYTGRIKPK